MNESVLRSNYVTKSEAIEFLYLLKSKPVLKREDCATLEMIRICLVGDQRGLSLWGKSIEKTRPVFIKSIPETQQYYEKDLEKALEIAKGV